MSTPHNAAARGDIAKIVLMPGDPLRAKFMADTYLEDVVEFNHIRNMLGYTGTFEGTRVSVMGSGMGIPSIGIYAHELYNIYGVEAIIRIGSAGGVARSTKLYDIVFAQGASTDSNFAAQYDLPGTIAPLCDYDLLACAVEEAKNAGVRYHVGNVLTTDVFYSPAGVNRAWRSMGVLAVEMEAAGLYLTAAALEKKALAILTVSDLVFTNEWVDAKERETAFTQMMEIALAVAKRTSTE